MNFVNFNSNCPGMFGSDPLINKTYFPNLSDIFLTKADKEKL